MNIEKDKLRIGQRVRAKNFANDRLIRNKYYYGTIKVMNNGSSYIGIVFDENIQGHRLDGNCRQGYGWYIYLGSFEVIDIYEKNSIYKCMKCFKDCKGKEIFESYCPNCKTYNKLLKVENI